MPTDLNIILALTEPAIKPSEYNVKALQPMVAKRVKASANANHISSMALCLTILAHVLVLLVILNAPKTTPLIEPISAPITVSLVDIAAPEPEIVPIVPVPPQPQPIVKKQKPKRELKPTPQPIEAAPVAAQSEQLVAEPTPPPAPAIKATEEVKPEIKPPPPPPETREPELVSGVAYIKKPDPQYPPISKRLQEHGTVVLLVLVSAVGEPESVEIKKSSGFSRLDEQAVESMKKARFSPYRKNNKALSFKIEGSITFNLED